MSTSEANPWYWYAFYGDPMLLYLPSISAWGMYCAGGEL